MVFLALERLQLPVVDVINIDVDGVQLSDLLPFRQCGIHACKQCLCVTTAHIATTQGIQNL